MSAKTPDDFDAVRAIVEALTPFDAKDQERILRWSREKMGLSIDRSSSDGHMRAAPPLGEVSSTAREPRNVDIRSFVDTKNPQSDNQFAAVVAYYYRFEAPEVERKVSIGAEDLQEATRRCGRSRFPRPSQTLVNAHGQGYLDKAERGLYGLNTVGENLVAMALPQAAGNVSRKAAIGRKNSAKRQTKVKPKPVSRTRSNKRK